MSTTVRVRSTTRYRSLKSLGMTDEQVLAALGVDEFGQPVEVDLDKPAAKGKKGKKAKGKKAKVDLTKKVTLEKGKGKAKGKNNGKAKAKKAKPAEPELTAGEALVAKHGLSFARGRVYINATTIEAQARVLKTGTPQIVESSTKGRAVLVERTETGDVLVQNLFKKG